MRKSTVLSLLFLLVSLFAYAQDNLDEEPIMRDANYDIRIAEQLKKLESLDPDNLDSVKWNVMLINLASAYKNKGEFLNAAYYGMKGLEIAEAHGDKRMISGSLNAMGNILKKQGHYAQALDYLNRALELRKGFKSRIPEAQTLNNLGLLYEEIGDFAKAQELHQSSLELRLEFNEKKVPSSYLNLGTTNARMGFFDRAISYYNQVLAFPELDKRLRIIATYHMGYAYAGKGLSNQAINHFKTSLQLATETGMGEYELRNTEGLSKSYEDLGAYELSLLYFRKFMDLKDEIYNANSNIQIAELQAIYENEKKEKALAVQSAALSEKELEINKQQANQRFLIILLIALTMASIGILIHLKNKKLVKEKMLHENFALQLIDSQERERKRIAAELHDSIGQNLLIIKNQLSLLITGKPGEATEKRMSLLTDTTSQTIEEIRTISYDLRPYQIDRLGLKTSLESMVDRVADSTELNIDYVIGEVNDIYSENNEINFYRIIQECLNNIVKHADAKNVSLSVLKTDHAIKLSIKDDGKGFDQDSHEGSGFGLIGLQERSRILNGKLNISSKEGEGTLVEIVFDLMAERRSA